MLKCEKVREGLAGVRFSKDAGDVAKHLRLMLDIRINYLKFKQIDLAIEQKGFSAQDVPDALKRLETIDNECGRLRKRFIKMNGHYLKDAGQSFNGWTYRGKIRGRMAVLQNM